MEHGRAYHHTIYRSSGKVRDAWRCKFAKESGKAGCSNPTVYTSEIDAILRNVLTVVFREDARKKIVDDLIKIYTDINVESRLYDEKLDVRAAIEDVKAKKNKLLDLNLAGRITDDEFEERNNEFSAEIADLKLQTAHITAQIEKNAEFADNAQNLRKIINRRLSFDRAMDSGVVESLLDRIEVHGGVGHDALGVPKRVIRLKVFLNVATDSADFEIVRGRESAITAARYSHTT
jgi:hypothetical protein